MSVTDEQILVSASRTLARIGPFRTTLNDVASALGLPAATLVKRLGSEHEPLVAVTEYETSEVEEIFTEIVAGHESLLERAVARGELVECDVDGLARAVQTTYNGALILWAINGDGELPEWVRRDVAFLLDPFDAPK